MAWVKRSSAATYARQKEHIASKAPKARDFTNQRTRYAGIIDEAVRETYTTRFSTCFHC